MSPVLFHTHTHTYIYADGLLHTLSSCGVGCFISDTFTGALAYADDIVLVAPMATVLLKLLDICGNYALAYCMSLNASKSNRSVVLHIKITFKCENRRLTV